MACNRRVIAGSHRAGGIAGTVYPAPGPPCPGDRGFHDYPEVSMKRIAAFIDFDGTLLTTHTAHLVGRFLRDSGARHFAGRPLSPLYLARILACRGLRKTGLMSEAALAAALLDFYRGRAVRDVEEWASGFYRDYLKPNLSAALVDIVRTHKKKGHVPVIVSGQVRTVLRHVAEDLGFDHVICTDLEDDGRGAYTGRPKGMICVDSNKSDLARAFAADNGIDLGSSYSYGNNEADGAILSMVGNPVAVEPTKRLEAMALARGWKIINH